MNLRAIVLTILAVVATACGSTTSNPQPYRAPVPVRHVPRQPQPVSQVPNYQAQPPAPVYHEHAPVRGGDVVLEVRGMTCPIKCVRQIKAMLGAAPGVKSVRVDFDAKAAIVSVEPGTDPESLTRYVRPPYSAYVVSSIKTR